jgi:hypothetical protein
LFSLDDKTAIENLVVGTTILGTGGGGSPQSGRATLESDLAVGRKLRVISLDEVADDALVVSPYYVGSVAPGAGTAPMKKKIIEDPFKTGVEFMERYFSRKVVATVPSELGGGNTAAALHVAAGLGIPLVDGDLLGRAGPELHQSTAHVCGTSMAPSVVVSETGDIVFVERYANIDDYEAIARHVSVLAGGHAAVVDTPLTKPVAFKVVIKGTISKALAVGKTVREAQAKGSDVTEAVRKALDGWLIFRGVVEKYEWRDEKGFLFAEATVKGTDRWRGHSLRSWIKNEHILAWVDKKPTVMPPDLIIFLDRNGVGVTNDALKLGLEVSVLAARAPDVWRTQKGLEFFGPRHFGFDYTYVPVERNLTA